MFDTAVFQHPGRLCCDCL